jgi:hypothetical protein
MSERDFKAIEWLDGWAKVRGGHGEAARAIKAIVDGFDANVDRLKACEHIADGDDGWEALRNLCPSTAAVARLRDRVTATPFLVCQECRHLISCVQKRTCRLARAGVGAGYA